MKTQASLSLPCHSLSAIYFTCLSSRLWRGEGKYKALSMLCHVLFRSSTKRSGYHLPSSLLTCGSCCFVEMWPWVFLPALCSFPRLPTSPWIAIPSICIPWCHFSFLVFLFCILTGGSRLDRTQNYYYFSFCIDFFYYSYQKLLNVAVDIFLLATWQ